MGIFSFPNEVFPQTLRCCKGIATIELLHRYYKLVDKLNEVQEEEGRPTSFYICIKKIL